MRTTEQVLQDHLTAVAAATSRAICRQTMLMNWWSFVRMAFSVARTGSERRRASSKKIFRMRASITTCCVLSMSSAC